MFVLNDGNERIKNQEKYRMSTSRRNQLAGRKTLPKNTRRKKKRGRKMLRIMMIPLMILLLFLLFKSCIQKKNQYADVDATQPEMDVQLLDINPYSRPGTTIDHVNGIVVHYTANPGSTAQDNRDYFNGLKDSHETSASSNFVIGLEGEIIQCIPTWEMAYAQMTAMRIRFRLNVVIRMRMESLLMQHTAHLYNLQHGFVQNMI